MNNKVVLKHLRCVRAKGRTYWYHRKTKERLPDDESARIRRVLEVNEGLVTPEPRVKSGSVEAVSNLYKGSEGFKRLAPRTQGDYRARLQIICDFWGEHPISSIQRKHVLRLQDKFADRPATADRTITVLRCLLAYAVEREFIAENPAQNVAKLVKPSMVEGRTPWPESATEKFLEVHEGTMMGLGAMIGLYTGQRLGDVVRMRWSDYDGTRISLRQEKTGTPLEIRAHSALKAALDAQPRVSPIILTTAAGRPFTNSNFRFHLRKAIKEAELDHLGLSFHGLRYAAAGQLTLLGLSLKHVASITGHKSLAMLQRYTRGAEQRLLADAAILKWEEHAKNGKVENRAHKSGKLKRKSLKKQG